MDIVTYALCKKAIQKSIETLGTVFTLKGNISSISELPSSGNTPGDIYLVGPNQDGFYTIYYWSSEESWETMGSTEAGFSEVITETTLYKGEDGTGTIEEPAEGTILDIIENMNNYIAGDYIDITNNKINVDGIVSKTIKLTNYVANTSIEGPTGEPIEFYPNETYHTYCSYTNPNQEATTFTFKVKGSVVDGELIMRTDSNGIVLLTESTYQAVWYDYHEIQIILPLGGTVYFQFYYNPNDPDNIEPDVLLFTESGAVLDDYPRFTNVFIGTNGSNNGKAGLVPAPTSLDDGKFLKADGTWAEASGGSGDYVSKTGDIMSGTLTAPNIIVGSQKSGTTLGINSTILGKNNTASGVYSVAEGYDTKALGHYSHAEGDSEVDEELRATIIDFSEPASDQDEQGTIVLRTSEDEIYINHNYSFFINQHGYALIEIINQWNEDNYNFWELTFAPGLALEDIETITKGTTIIGLNTGYSLAAGISSHTENGMNVAAGHYSHAEGLGTLAGGKGAHSEGTGTRALEENSHAEGNYAQAYKFSHAEGNYTEALGRGAHAEGDLTVANGLAQHVEGTLNIKDALGGFSTPGNYIHIAGNGRNVNARSNAYTLDWAGNGWFAGDVYTGSTSGTNKDAGSKKLATDDTFMGTNGTENGSKGLVPAPTSQDTNKYLKSDGTWSEVSGGGTSYTAGDYIDITNNEISVTGIVPNGSTRTPLTLTTGQYYYCRDQGDPVTLTTEANSGYYKVDNNTSTSQDYVFQFSSAIGDDKYVIFAMGSNNTALYDYVLSNPISFHNQTGATKYYENAYFGVTLKPGESFVISCESTDLYQPSAYLISVTSRETLQPTLGYYFTAAEGYPIEIDDILEEPWGYFVYENTGNSGVFGFKICSYSNDDVLFATTDSSNIVLGVSNSSIDFAYEPRMIGVYLNSGDKIYFNAYIDGYTPSVEVYSEDTAVLDNYTKFTDTFVGTDGTSNGKAGVVPAPTSSDANKYLKSDGTWGTVSAGSSDYDDLTDKPQINGVTLSGNKTATDLGLDMVILSYGNSTWQEFLNAYRRNAVVYCRAGSGSDPASGNQSRLAFMAYINNVTSPTEVEFQYYRSVSTKTASQQGDQVIVYKLTSSGTWTVTTRENGSKVVAGTNMTSSYSNGVLTLNASDSIFEGTDGTNAGTKGLVPAPTTSDTDKYLKSDGTWATVSGGSGNYVSKTGDTMTGTLTTPNIIVGNQKNSTTLGTKSSIFGRDGTASGNYCIVEGDSCTAKDDACHAEGYNCIAGAGGNGGDYAHAEGCETKATGFCSHSEGYNTTASEYHTHAEGENTVAAGINSHAEGYGTKANRGFTHVQGIYNILDDTGAGSSKGTYAHIVGNGSADNNRKNIHTIKWTGEAWFQGDVYVGSTGGKNKDEGSKKLATEEYVRNLLQEFATLNNLNMPS